MANCGGGYYAFCPISNHFIISSCVNDLTWTRVWSKPVSQEELAPLVQAQNLTLSFSSESSIQEELKRESTADAITILVSTSVGMVFHMSLGWLIHFSYIVLIKLMRLFFITSFLPTYLYLWGTSIAILVHYEESCLYVIIFHLTLGWLIHFSYIFLIKSMGLFYITSSLFRYLYLWGTPLAILVYY